MGGWIDGWVDDTVTHCKETGKLLAGLMAVSGVRSNRASELTGAIMLAISVSVTSNFSCFFELDAVLSGSTAHGRERPCDAWGSGAR